MTVEEIFRTLESDNSRLFKEKVLTEHRDNSDLKEAIRLALNPHVNFYLRQIPDYSPAITDTSLAYSLQSLSELSERRRTGHAARDYLQEILNWSSDDDAKTIIRVINKDLKCGVQTSTANKIWPGLIPEYPIMLASQFDKKLVDKLQWPAYAQLKADGMRFNAIVKNESVEYYSRNGKPLDILGVLDKEFIKLAGGGKTVFDGELVCRDRDGKILERKIGNGILQKANKGTMSEEESKLVHAVVWDYIPYKAFLEEKWECRYSLRFEVLKFLIDVDLPTRIRCIETREVRNLEEAQEVFKSFLNKGEEGIILKDKNSIWENKRSKSNIKFKAELQATLRCIRVEYGTGRNANRVGNLILQTEDGLIECGCGSGLSDADRDRPFSDYENSLIEITYNARIQDKMGNKESLFLPIFNYIRTDKDRADYARELK